jgi:hypothetical protein
MRKTINMKKRNEMLKVKLNNFNKGFGMKNGEKEKPTFLEQLWGKNVYRITEMGDLTSAGEKQCSFCDEIVPNPYDEFSYSFVLKSKDGCEYFVCYKCMARIRRIISQQLMINPAVWDIEGFDNPFLGENAGERKTLDKRLVDPDTLNRWEKSILELYMKDYDVDMVYWKRDTSKSENMEFRKYIRDLIDEIDRAK